MDMNKDGVVSAFELKSLLIGIRFEDFDLDLDDAVYKLLKDFDTSNDDLIDEAEFIRGIEKWLNQAKRAGASSDPGHGMLKFVDDFHKQTKREYALLGAEEQSDEVIGGGESPKLTSFKALMMLLCGTVITATFADPLVDAVDNFSDVTSIPSFFVSFIALPLITNLGDAVSAITFASKKNIRTTSLTFSELYGNITVKNFLSLSVMLAVVYFKGLTWDFSSEVVVILLVCIVMGVFASFCTTFPLWTCLVAYVLWPFSLALVYVLNYVF